MSNSFISYYNQSAMDYFNIQPYAVKGQANATTQYYKRMLYNKIYSVYDFNIPDERELGWFRYFLFHFGSVAYLYSNDSLGWIFYPYAITKLNYILRPAEIEVVLMNDQDKDSETFTRTIGENAEIVHIFDDFYGVDDIVTRYAEMLAECDKSININLMNSNVSLASYVDNKKDAEVLKEAYQKATAGEPFIVINKELLIDENGVFKPLFNDVKSTFIANDLCTTRRSIMNAFLTEVGIRNSNYDKRERLTTSEISENNDETRSIVEIIYNNISDCFERCNALSGNNLSVKLNYDYTDDTIEPAEEVEQ